MITLCYALRNLSPSKSLGSDSVTDMLGASSDRRIFTAKRIMLDLTIVAIVAIGIIAILVATKQLPNFWNIGPLSGMTMTAQYLTVAGLGVGATLLPLLGYGIYKGIQKYRKKKHTAAAAAAAAAISKNIPEPTDTPTYGGL